MICLSAMGTREKKSFVVVGGESFDGMAMEEGRGSFIYGFQLAAGVKIYPYEVS